MLDAAWLLDRVPFLILLILSLTIHEYSHAWMAFRLGDDTAARAGRLTLNPLPHIDLLGTILLPLMNAPIGWAKPVPTDTSRVRRDITVATADILVSSVGPLSNLLFGFFAAVLLGLVARFAPAFLDSPGILPMAQQLIGLNAALCIFNLLPIPPLDGSHVARSLVPYRWRGGWDTFARYAPFLLIALVLFGRRLPFLFVPIQLLAGAMLRVAQAIA